LPLTKEGIREVGIPRSSQLTDPTVLKESRTVLLVDVSFAAHVVIAESSSTESVPSDEVVITVNPEIELATPIEYAAWFVAPTMICSIP
jgi:hypothetical protein